MNTLEQALMRDGRAVEIERIEIECLENCRFRWKLWAGGELIYCAVGQPSDIAAMVESTKIITQGMLGVYHEESSTTRATAKGIVTGKFRRSGRSQHTRDQGTQGQVS